MKKTWLIFLLLTAILLSACSQVIPTDSAVASPLATATATRLIPTQAEIQMECQVVSLSPTPGPTEVSKFPPIQEDDWVRGNNPNARLTIIEYSDFQCPYCDALAVELEKLYKNHPDDVRIVFRHFPIPSHLLAKKSAYASEAAGLQGKFWEMHDILFASQETTALMTEAQFNDWLVEQAQDLGLDKEKFIEDMNSQGIIDKVENAQKRGIEIEIPGTPMVLINGQIYQGPRDEANFEAILQMYQLEGKQFTSCPSMVIDPKKQYIATLQTEKGNVVIQLFADKAPMAVNSFVFLSQEGWYNNITFHYVQPGFVAQTGDPSGSGLGSAGYYFSHESSDLKFDKPGVVAMVTSGKEYNGSQFFITYQAAPSLDGSYTIFGEVIEGMDVLEKLTARDPSKEMGLPPGDKILSITIKEK